jgi:hypothetical protein
MALPITRPGLSRYAASPPPTRRCFGHGPQGRPRLLVRAARQRDKTGRGKSGLLDRHVRLLLTPSLIPELAPGDRPMFEARFKNRRRLLKKLGPPPWVIARRFADTSDDAVIASVFALHVADEEPWLVRGVLRLTAEGGLVLRRVSVEHLTDEKAEVTAKAVRVPLAAIRDRARFYLRQSTGDSALAALEVIRPLTSAERRRARRVASAAAVEPLRRGRKGYPESHYQRIALRAVELFESGRRDVLRALEQQEGRPYQTVRDWVGRARALGFLEPVTQGRTDFHPGPNLYRKENDG